MRPAASVALAGLAVLPLVGCAGGGPDAGPAASSTSTGSTTSSTTSTNTATPSGSSSGASESRGSSQPDASGSATAQVSCLDRAKTLTREQKVGQLFMTATTGTRLSPDVRRVVAEHQIGSVLYLGEGPSGVDATAVHSAEIQAAAAGRLPILVAVDQEGGQVQRLSGPGFSTIASAAQQAQWDDATLTARWKQYGRELATGGVRFNLAPVADLVPSDMTSRNDPIGKLRRGYGSDPATVVAKASAAVTGMHQAGLVTSVKHFPGIGRVTTNTDFGAATDTVTTADDLATFTGVIDGGADSVMVSSVVYQQLDKANPAVFSKAIVTDLLRGRLGWQGAVVSDDLGAAEAVAGVPAGERGVRFIAAGGDLVIDADPTSVDEMVAGVLQRAEQDEAFAAGLDEHVARVLALKASAKLLQCQA